jgi:hypothetical protein
MYTALYAKLICVYLCLYFVYIYFVFEGREVLKRARSYVQTTEPSSSYTGVRIGLSKHGSSRSKQSDVYIRAYTYMAKSSLSLFRIVGGGPPTKPKINNISTYIFC